MRRIKNSSAIAILGTLIVFISCSKTVEKESITVNNLRCEFLNNPLGIDVQNPKLSWQIHSEQKNILQTAYQVLVATDPELLNDDKADLWNSGKINSDQSIHVVYEGKKLKSRVQCYWKVKTWSQNGESDWSETAYWSMGLLNYNDWRGRWIGFDRAFDWDRVERFSQLSARYFRKEFKVDSSKEIKTATIYIIGLGLYELYLNGSKIGNHVLAPAPTDYWKNVKYNSFDVTQEVKNGVNAIGTILGNGRFFTMRQNYKPYKIKTFGFPKMLLNLYIEYNDGTIEVIRTDNSWKGTADGPIRSNNEYDGEIFDARKEMPGWNMPGFDDKKWLKAEYVQEPGGEYQAQMNNNMRVMSEITPVSISKRPNNKYIIDFGQNFSGWVRIKTSGNKGDKITLRFAESLDQNGELFTAPLRDAIVTDHYTCKGGSEEEWEPSFVYHGFRYAEVTGITGNPTKENFVGCVVYDDMETIGHFETSDTLLNKIFQNAFWSVISTYKGMPIDCPQRNERMPWLGDRAIGCYGESYMVDNSKLYEKWLDDIMYSQKSDGCISDVAPPYFRYYSDNMTWPGTYLFVADMLYRQYGLIQPIQKHYANMKLWLDYMKDRHLVDYIMTKDSYGDWCAPFKTIEEGRGKSANVKYPSTLISTAYYYKYLKMMQQFAGISGHQQDIQSYKDLCDSVFIAFNKTFFNTENGYYGDKKLTENLLALSFEMVPDDKKDTLLQKIEEIIMVDNAGHLSVGLVGAQWLMRSLSENGMKDIAWKLATNTTFPSWGYMVENGATSIWELWNANTAAPNMNSQNHVMMLGDLIIWYFENLAGIQSHAEKSGFKTIVMKPDFRKELQYINASYQSAYGKIISSWSRKDSDLEWKVSIPANTEAILYLPSSDKNLITENGVSITESDDILEITLEKDLTKIHIGSGTYNFNISDNL
jgi:alpha-L-rhamnosidase